MPQDKNLQDSLHEDDVQTTFVRGRRSFLKVAGLGVAGIAVVGAAAAAAAYHDFPKGASDSNVTENKDLKAVDSDANNSKAVDSNQNRLRDVKRSTNSD